MPSRVDLEIGLPDERDRLVTAYNRIGSIILGTPDVHEALGKLAREIVEVGIFRSLMVALVDEDGRGIEVVHNIGQFHTSTGTLPKWKNFERTIGVRYDIDDANITSTVARTGEMQIIEEWDSRFDSRTDRPEYKKGQVSYFLPVKKGARTLAVLATGSTAEDKEEHLARIKTIQPLLDQVAVAIEHARLIERTREREARLSAILNNAAVGICATDRQGRFTGVNDHFVRMLGYGTESEVLGLTFKDVTHPDDLQTSHRLFTALANGDVPNFQTEKRYLRKDGSPFWGEVFVSPIETQTGIAEAFCAVMSDISNRKEAEQKLRESEQRYRAIIEDQTEFVVRWKPDGTRTFVNDSYCRYFGRTREELLGTSFLPTLHPDDQRRIQQLLACLTPENPSVTNEHRSLVADGSMVWQEWTDRAIFDDDGNVIEYQSVGRDIRKRKAVEDRLRLQAQLLDSVNEAIVATDLEGRILYWGRGATELYGIDATEMVGTRVKDIVSGDAYKTIERRLRLALERGSLTETIKRTRRDGTTFWSYSTISLTHGIEGKPSGFVAIDRDISQIREAEEERVRTQRLRAAAELSAGVSHNLNNILTGVLGYGELLRGMVTDEKQAQYLDHIVQSGIRASDLIHRLHLSTRDGGQDELEPVSVHEAIEEAVQITRPRWKDELEAGGAAIDLTIECDGDPYVLGTRIGLYDILVNLILNAVDVLPDGGQLSICSAPLDDGDMIEIIVRDTGAGMDEETRQRVFEPFFTTKQDVGTGLGLSVSKTAVEGWGGTMDVKSVPGQGSTFRILLRASQKSEQCVDTEISPVESADTGLDVLIVDDEPIVGSLLQEVLGDHHDVAVAHDGESALRLAETRRFEIAFLDMGLPGLPGNKLREALTASNPDLTTILMTGWEDQNLGRRGEGFDFRIQKPFRMTEILRLMGEITSLARARREAEPA